MGKIIMSLKEKGNYQGIVD